MNKNLFKVFIILPIFLYGCGGISEKEKTSKSYDLYSISEKTSNHTDKENSYIFNTYVEGESKYTINNNNKIHIGDNITLYDIYGDWYTFIINKKTLREYSGNTVFYGQDENSNNIILSILENGIVGDFETVAKEKYTFKSKNGYGVISKMKKTTVIYAEPVDVDDMPSFKEVYPNLSNN